MKYLCLGYFDQKATDARPKTEIDAVMEQCWPHMENLYKTGQCIVDVGLNQETTGLRRVQGRVVVSDGPFVETKEMLGGAQIIEAENLEEAIRIASIHPTTQIPEGEGLGWRMEIHPIHYYKEP